MATQFVSRRFTTDEYERMAEAGILGEDERIELIAGEVVRMAAMGSRYAGCVQRMDRRLQRSPGDSVAVRAQLPISIPAYDEPEPDLAVVRHGDDDYDSAHPGPDDVLLLIETADTSLPTDRAVRLPLYARARIPETWLVNLPGDGLERHSDPSPTGYRLVAYFRRGQLVRSMVLPSLEIAVDDVPGPERRQANT